MCSGTSETVSMDSVKCIRPLVSVLFHLKYPSRDLRTGGGHLANAPPIPYDRIMGLASCEHTDGRVHFTGYIETVSDVPGHVWSPLARISDLRSHRETAKPMVRQPKLCEDLCWGTLKQACPAISKIAKNLEIFCDFSISPKI